MSGIPKHRLIKIEPNLRIPNSNEKLGIRYKDTFREVKSEKFTQNWSVLSQKLYNFIQNGRTHIRSTEEIYSKIEIKKFLLNGLGPIKLDNIEELTQEIYHFINNEVFKKGHNDVRIEDKIFNDNFDILTRKIGFETNVNISNQLKGESNQIYYIHYNNLQKSLPC